MDIAKISITKEFNRRTQAQAEADQLRTAISTVSKEIIAAAHELQTGTDPLALAAAACEGALDEPSLRAIEDWAAEEQGR